jgi:diadenosine tetraphosphate (Ap4A) HIT family hydrolase
VDGPSCPICERGEPTDIGLELGHSWVTVPPRTPLPGYVVIVSKRHVREPFELPDVDRLAFWSDVDRVAAALDRKLHPDKLNYEIHGNTIPHLHLHLYPRWHGDRFGGRPIDWREAEPRTDADRAAIEAVLESLHPDTTGP